MILISLQVLVGSSAGYFIFISLSLISLTLALLYHSSGEQTKRSRRWIWVSFGVITCVCCAVWFTLLGLMSRETAGSESFHLYHKCEAAFASSISLIAAMVFLTYGLLLYRTYGFGISRVTQYLTKRILALSLICGLSFLLRTVAFIVLSFVTFDATTNLVAQTSEQVLLEALPICLIIVCGVNISMRRKASSDGEARSLVN